MEYLSRAMGSGNVNERPCKSDFNLGFRIVSNLCIRWMYKTRGGLENKTIKMVWGKTSNSLSVSVSFKHERIQRGSWGL